MLGAFWGEARKWPRQRDYNAGQKQTRGERVPLMASLLLVLDIDMTAGRAWWRGDSGDQRLRRVSRRRTGSGHKGAGGPETAAKGLR